MAEQKKQICEVAVCWICGTKGLGTLVWKVCNPMRPKTETDTDEKPDSCNPLQNLLRFQRIDGKGLALEDLQKENVLVFEWWNNLKHNWDTHEFQVHPCLAYSKAIRTSQCSLWPQTDTMWTLNSCAFCYGIWVDRTTFSGEVWFPSFQNRLHLWTEGQILCRLCPSSYLAHLVSLYNQPSLKKLQKRFAFLRKNYTKEKRHVVHATLSPFFFPVLLFLIQSYVSNGFWFDCTAGLPGVEKKFVSRVDNSLVTILPRQEVRKKQPKQKKEG